ncbi:TonB-dependent outer membrane receptor [Aliidongia dinghuensis]|uniref:TonB-dependent outer membrane receptor n=1 Tax=Aliidongia dinghuensis TaxID=1867774 RepID=A0A8J2Z106_9PROT|nr:STN domain-containing protein [Aliidongia dinghuensis]GGF47625.1 TonB-dependent outer membrane receptor [Aliidongia dinghuensis]
MIGEWLNGATIFLAAVPIALWIEAGVSGALAADALSGKADVATREDRRQFDIPPQSLALALDAYSAVTGMEVFYDGALSRGRRSSGVTGLLSPEAALRALLDGTGLVALRTDVTSFTVRVAQPDAPMPRPAPAPATLAPYAPYFTALQASVGAALCRNRAAQSTPEDVLVRLWVGPDGRVRQVELASEMADRSRAGDIVRGLEDVWTGQPPPAMPQPITIVIFSRAPGERTRCNPPPYPAPEGP